MQLLKKLSAKEIMGNVLSVVKEMEVGEVKKAFAVAGVCSAYETGISTFGEWKRFIGDFQAINYLTGEISRAPSAHVPDVLESIMYTAIKDQATIVGEKSSKNAQYYSFSDSLEFAYEVDIERMPDDEKEGIKYKYITRPKTEVTTNDAIAHLTKLLEPPKAEEQVPETDAQTEPVKGKGKGKAA